MVSFTGSTRAGILVAKAAADTVKRVHQELGGKSPNIVLTDADFVAVLPPPVQGVLVNTGQGCIAPTRILVQKEREAEAGDRQVDGTGQSVCIRVDCGWCRSLKKTKKKT